MYRVELKGFEEEYFRVRILEFLMYRVELKVVVVYKISSSSSSFLMYRVELKGVCEGLPKALRTASS